jgi:hypothetical protein
MAVYRPKYRDKKTGELIESQVWWYKFAIAGRQVRESTKTHLLTLAREAEQNRRRELEWAFVGAPMQKRASRVNSVAGILESYLAGYEHGALRRARLCHLGGRCVPQIMQAA